jgi:hypothetical protein
MAPVLKTGVPERVPGVRIPPSPPYFQALTRPAIRPAIRLVWLEEHWPKIVKPLLAARNPRQVAGVLRPIAKAREIRPQWQKRIVGHPAKLLDFLRSEKFRIKPPKKTVVDALTSVDVEKRKVCGQSSTDTADCECDGRGTKTEMANVAG